MKVTPKTEEELQSFELLPKGEYPFTVLESGEIESKSAKNKGRLMFAVKLNVHGPNGDKHVYDYFADWFSEWKLKHFCDTVGLEASYQSGDIDGAENSFAGKQGYVKLKISSDPQYGEKNEVVDYLVDDSQKKAPAKPAAQIKIKVNTPPPESDDVPF